MQKVTYFAYDYNTSAYGRSNYSYNQGGGGTTPGGSATGNNSLLSNTGLDILVIVTLACILALIAVLVRYWRRQPSSDDQR